MTTDGPAALRRIADDADKYGHSVIGGVFVPRELRDIAAAWDAERAQAAADRAALADVRMAHTALNTLFDDAMRERDDLRVKLEEAYKALEVIGTRKDAAEAALAQARALAHELCLKIETLPASELQTEISIMASSLAAALSGGAR